MCGIAGRLNFRTGAPVDAGLLRGMSDLLAHRGPDGEGLWHQEAVGLAHRRLAIVDLTDAARQPMTAEDPRVRVVCNGEIYNFRELCTELEARGHRFRTQSDTEVLLAAYAAHGVECLSRLRGMFAFALWDGGRRRLLLARDRTGKKPLYYRMDGDGIAFASEPKAFLADPSFEPRPDVAALSDYLTYHYGPAPGSAFAGVRRVPPAHYLLVEDGQVHLERYWRLRYEPKRQLSDDDAAAELLTYLPDDLLVKVDIATMAHGLEGRSPFLDHNVMEFCASLPSDLKIRRLTTKYLLKRAVRDLLRGELRAMVHDVLLDPGTLERGYFREPVVRRLLDEHARGVRGWHDQLWSLLVLELWHRTFVDRRPGAGSPLAAVGVHRAAALAP